MELVFGGMPDAGRFVVAFMLVLGLIGAGALLWRRFGAGPLGPIAPRSRQPRLAVIDAATVDARRRLVLIKRDNVEHLVMIGGPTDIVVESNISRTGATAVSREPRPIPESSRHPTFTDPNLGPPLEPAARPLRLNGDLDPPPEAQHRTAREAMVDSMQAVRSPARRGAAPELETPPQDGIGAPSLTPPPLSAEVNHRPPAAPEPRRTPSLVEAQRLQATSESGSPASDAGEPKRAASATSRAAQSDENSLAEMAQRLEAALRRPTKPTESAAPPSPGARSPGRSESPPLRKPVLDGVNASKGTVKPTEQVSPASKGTVKPTEQVPPPELKILSGKAKTEPAAESLEDEMAKMLGRSPAK